MRNRSTIHFLVVYDHQEREQLALKTYTDSRTAVAAYNAIEQEYEDRPRVEVVLLGADSEDTIRITHPVYFQSGPLDAADLFKPFKDLLARARLPLGPTPGSGPPSAPKSTERLKALPLA